MIEQWDAGMRFGGRGPRDRARVGGRLGELGPVGTPALGDALAHAVLPVVLRRLERGGELLGELIGNGRNDRPGSWKDAVLHEARAETRRLGWVVGLLASASGADLLLVRRDPCGLATLLELVDEALRAEGRGLDLRWGVPRLAPDVGAGWELPWTVATMLLESARSAPAGLLAWTWSPEGCIECPRAATPAVRHAVELLRARLPGVALRTSRGAWRLDFPAEYLEVPAAA